MDHVHLKNHIVIHEISECFTVCHDTAYFCGCKKHIIRFFFLWHGTAAQLAALDAQVYGKRVTPYGVEALVRRDAMPAGAELTPVSIEELFVLMVKGENVQ